jgi:threonine aldolase
MMNIIDLRSDTVTKPTDAMRGAMATAEVGDDVYGEDPTVNRLEAIAAEMLGKEAAVFVVSGTMGNLISLLSHGARGDEVILGDNAHIFYYEQGGMSAVGGLMAHTVPNLADGTLALAAIEHAIRADDEHFARTRIIALENTHNRCGGRVLTPEYTDAVGALAHANGLMLHIDGARLWNAAVAQGVSPARLAAAADSVTCCLSEGLAAPVGSVIAGSAAFIRQARRNRKLLGGGMRQAGVLAAAGIVALTEMLDRLADDHANARTLAHGLARIDGLAADPTVVDTNIVVAAVTRDDVNAVQVAEALSTRGILLNPLDMQRMRIVTNYHVTPADVEQVLDTFQELMRGDVVAAGGGAYIYG